MQRIKENKTQKTFWKVINSDGIKKEDISKDIKEKKWMEDFKNIYCEKGIEKDPTIDLRMEKLEESWIYEEEIQTAIRKMKKRKASGGDGMPNKFSI